MCNLKLADLGDPSSEYAVGMLICINFYYSFFKGKTIRQGQFDPVASSTVLGSVPNRIFKWIKFWEPRNKSCIQFQRGLQKIWDLETADCFEEYIAYNGTRYV